MLRTLFLASTIVIAAPARADECDTQTAEMIAATGAEFVRRSLSGDRVFLRHPIAVDFTMGCRDRPSAGPGSVDLSVDTPSPTQAYFELLARAAAISMRLPADAVLKAARDCHKQALADKSELSQINTRLMDVECQSFRRDGGGTNISVFPARKD